MTLDLRKQCPVCAWRENCKKKHTLRQTALYCPDFVRDRTLPDETDPSRPAERHKRLEDVFDDD